MPKQVLIAIVVGVLALLGIGGFVFMQKGKSQQPNSQTPTAQQTPSAAQPAQSSNKGSLKDLLLAGKTVSCVIDTGGQNPVKGTTYVSGKKIRTDFTTLGVSGKETKAHMIQDGTFVYIWTDDGLMGTKMKVEAEQNAGTGQTGQSQGQNQGMDVNQQVDMNCSAWIANDAMFVPPANVKFTDLSEVLKKTPTVSKSDCDLIADPTAKAACLGASAGQ